MKLKQIYKLLIDAEAERCNEALPSHAVKQLDDLPNVIKAYLAKCGYNANDRKSRYNTKWKYARLKIKPGKKWSSVDRVQTNFINTPARVGYIETKLFGIIPLGAVDSFTAGAGRMFIKLLSFFSITNATGPEMDQSGLVAILAEAILIPRYFFQHYITLTEIDEITIKATIQYNNIKATGIFYFNRFNEFLRFESTDRYYSGGKGFENYKWTAYAWNYKERNGKVFPSNFMAVWSLPSQNYTYFKGRVDSID